MSEKVLRLIKNGKESNKAVTVVAIEVCCFIWRMETSNYEGGTQCKTEDSDYTLRDEISLD